MYNNHYPKWGFFILKYVFINSVLSSNSTVSCWEIPETFKKCQSILRKFSKFYTEIMVFETRFVSCAILARCERDFYVL